MNDTWEADEPEPRGRLSPDDTARLTEHFAGLTSAGLPLASGLRALAQEQPSRRLRGVLNSLSRSLDAGEPLDVALVGQNGRVPAYLRGLVTAGMRTGKMGHVLGRYVGYAGFGTELRRRLMVSLSYPIFTWALATCVMGFLVAVVARSFANIFADFGVPLPMVSRVVIALSKYAVELGRLAPSIAVVLLILLVVFFVLTTSARRRSIISRVPLIGWVWRLTTLAEFCHLLALLVEADVPLAEALVMAGDGVRDAELQNSCRAVADGLTSGSSLAEGLIAYRVFPMGLVRIIEWAEQHHSLPEALHMAAEMFESSAKTQASVTSIVCNVLTAIFLIVGVLTFIVAIVIPLFTLMSKLM